MDWLCTLAHIIGAVDQELLLRNECLAAENRILKARFKTPVWLNTAERWIKSDKKAVLSKLILFREFL